jgi:hypothetical protein
MNENKIEQLQLQLEELKLKFEKQISCPELREIWIPKNELMDFMGFAETQFNEIVRRYNIVYSQIGKKRFYLVESIKNVMNTFINQNK